MTGIEIRYSHQQNMFIYIYIIRYYWLHILVINVVKNLNMVVIERAQTNTQLRGIHKLGSD